MASFWNVIVLGVSFLFMFSAFQTASFFEATVLKALGYGSLGFIGPSVLYFAFAGSNMLAPHVIAAVGVRACMVIGGCLYVLMLASLIYIIPAVFIVASFLNGVGAALLWTGQGTVITRSSTQETRGRDNGIFWSLLQCSLITGSVISSLVFPEGSEISIQNARVLFIILTSLCAGGVLCLLLLRPVGAADVPKPLIETLKEVTVVARRKDVLLLNVLVFYTGMELSFWQGLYPSIIANKSPIDLPPETFNPHATTYMLMVIGVAEIGGSIIFGRASDRIGREPVVIAGSVFHCAAFVLVYCGFVTQVLPPTILLAYGCAFLLGVGDAIVNTQCSALLGDMYPDRSEGAFAFFFLCKSISSAAAFFYSPHVPIGIQLTMLLAMSLIGTSSFVMSERMLKANQAYVELPDAAVNHDTGAAVSIPVL